MQSQDFVYGSNVNCIARLQEYTQGRRLALPFYDIVKDFGGYRASVYLQNLSATATAFTKKEAKHLCAARLLEKIAQENGVKFSVVTSTPQSVATNVTIEVSSNQSPLLCLERVTISPTTDFNAVGALNEKCQKLGQVLPTYSDVPSRNMQFGIQCKLLHLSTVGWGLTKKQAKHKAAALMYEQMENENKTSEKNPFSTSNDEVDDSYIKMLRQKFVECKIAYKNQKAPVPPAKEPEIEIRSINVEQSLNFEPSTTIADAIRRLDKMKIPYKIIELQTKPIILALKLNNTGETRPHTVIAKGETFVEAKLNLLNKSIEIFNVLLASDE